MDTLIRHIDQTGFDASPIRHVMPSPHVEKAPIAEAPAFKKFLREARDIAELKQRIATVLRSFKISHFSHQNLASPEHALDLFGNIPTGFVRDYIRNGFHLVDFQVLRVRQQQNPPPLFQSDLTEYLRTSPFLSDDMQANIDLGEALRKHGMPASCGIVISDDVDTSLLRVAATNEWELRNTIENHLEELKVIGLCIGEVGSSTKFKRDFHNLKRTAHLRLSPARIALLRKLQDDMTLNEVTAVLNISISTANQHIAAAKKTFQTTTTHGTLIAAWKAGYLKF